jgi:F0F1-type ATP synthase membrane subunit b/b'
MKRSSRVSGTGRLLAGAALLVVLAIASVAGAVPPQPHGDEAHGTEHHVPHLSDINWFHGFVSEREGVEPSLLWRAPGTPPPVAAMLLNTLVLAWLLVRFGGPAVRAGLTARKERVQSGIAGAAAMKREAEEQLAHYEAKLARIDQEIERVRTEMRDQAEAERKRVLAEATVRREQMERDARVLLAQELKAAQEALFHEVVAGAMQSAEAALRGQLAPADQQRLAEEFLADIERSLAQRGVEVRS